MSSKKPFKRRPQIADPTRVVRRFLEHFLDSPKAPGSYPNRLPRPTSPRDQPRRPQTRPQRPPKPSQTKPNKQASMRAKTVTCDTFAKQASKQAKQSKAKQRKQSKQTSIQASTQPTPSAVERLEITRPGSAHGRSP